MYESNEKVQTKIWGTVRQILHAHLQSTTSSQVEGEDCDFNPDLVAGALEYYRSFFYHEHERPYSSTPSSSFDFNREMVTLFSISSSSQQAQSGDVDDDNDNDDDRTKRLMPLVVRSFDPVDVLNILKEAYACSPRSTIPILSSTSSTGTSSSCLLPALRQLLIRSARNEVQSSLSAALLRVRRHDRRIELFTDGSGFTSSTKTKAAPSDFDHKPELVVPSTSTPPSQNGESLSTTTVIRDDSNHGDEETIMSAWDTVLNGSAKILK
jgi:hypothetical protein